MKKEVYNQAMRKLKMSDDCLGAILDSIDEIAVQPQEKKVRHIKLVPLLTAAAVFVFGGITVAAETGAFDWVKSFFHEEEIPAFYLENTGKMNNFKCESDFGIELSPVGVLGEGKDICCVFEVENLPEDIDIDMKDLGITLSSEVFENYHDTHPEVNGLGGGASFIELNDENENLIGIIARSDAEMFATGTEISFDIYPIFNDSLRNIEFREKYGFDENEMMNVAEISFTLESKKSKEKVIDYSTYMCSDIPERNYGFLFDEISISPLTINATGSRTFYGDEMLNTSDMILVFDDGSKLNLNNCSGWGASYNGDYCGMSWESNNTTLEERAMMYGDQQIMTSWFFDKPINPDTVTEIWLGKMRIYNSAKE